MNMEYKYLFEILFSVLLDVYAEVKLLSDNYNCIFKK